MSYIESFIDRLNSIPPRADQLLRQIRELDKEVEMINLRLNEARDRLLESLQKPTHQQASRNQLQRQYRGVSQMEVQMQDKANEKIALAEKLYTLIHEPTQRLDRQIHQRGLDKVMDDEVRRKKHKKAFKRGVEMQDDPNQPKYCYCGRPSFGEMVFCQNRLCQRQWFHIQCIELRDKKLPEKWYCRNCRPEGELKKGRKK